VANTIEYIYKLIDQYSPKLKVMKNAQKQLIKDVGIAQQQLAGLQSGFRTLTTVGAIAAIGGLTAAFVKGVSLASDLTEAQNVVSTTFKEATPVMDAWAKTALDSFGLSELQAKQFTGTMGALLKSTGITGDNLSYMAQDLTGLAGDFASFYNLPHEEAFMKLRSGISGETEPLKQLGINMSVANMETFALTQGIKTQWKNMSQQQQTMLRYQFIMNASRDAQGDFNKTLEESLANQQRVLQTRFGEKLGQIMLPILPKITDIFKKLNKIVAGINAEEIGLRIVQAFDLAMNIISKAINTIKIMYKIIKPFVPMILGMVVAWKIYRVAMMTAVAVAPMIKYVNIIMRMVKAQKSANIVQAIFNALMRANPVGMVITAIGIAIGLTIILYKNWDKVMELWNKAKNIFTDVTDKIADVFNVDPETLREVIINVTKMFLPIIDVIREIQLRWQYVKLAFTTGGIGQGILAIGKVIVSALLNPLEAILKVASNIPGVGKWAKNALQGIANFKEKLFGDEEAMRKKQAEMDKERARMQADIEETKNTDIMKSLEDRQKNALYNTEKITGALDQAAGATERLTVKRVGDLAAMLRRSQYDIKYVAAPTTPTVAPVVNNQNQNLNANMDLNIYTEKGIGIQPFNKSGNLGMNMNYAK